MEYSHKTHSGSHLRLRVKGGLVPEEAMVGHLDDMFQLPGLLLHLGCQEEGGRRDGIAMEAGEGVEHVEAVHVHDGGVDRQLVTVRLELRKYLAWLT